MKKGLTITLLTVAIAMFGYQAMAMAPTISQIPSPIVGNKDVTATNQFVFVDAIDLDKYVTDDTSPTAKILWSYEQSGAKYLLNGIPSIADTDPAGIELNPGPKNIAANLGTGELNLDGNLRTVTIRNKDLSPLTGTGATPGANNADHVIPAETGTITLYASDGTTYSQHELMIFSDNGGLDRLSLTPTATPVVVYHPPINSATHGGFVADTAGKFGSVTFGYGTANDQLCMETTPMGDNMGTWVGVAGDMPLAANSVYDIELKMTSSNGAPGNTPFWDVFLDNNNNQGTGENLYGGDAYFLDNEGGANSAVTAGKTFHYVWAPLAVSTPQFAAAYTSTVGTTKLNGRFAFRVMDAWKNGTCGFRADIQSGTICLKELTVTKYAIEGVKAVGAPLYNQSSFTYSSGPGVAGNFCTTDLVKDIGQPAATTVTVDTADGNAIKIAPTTGGQTMEYTSFFPGDTANTLANHDQADNYPVAYDNQTIYRASYTIVAADANAVTNPPDCFYINFDTPTNEVIQQNFVTSGLGACAMPKAAASTYVSFYHSNYGSNTTIGAEWKRFRPSFIVANMGSLGGTSNNNSGVIKIKNIKVEKVTLQ